MFPMPIHCWYMYIFNHLVLHKIKIKKLIYLDKSSYFIALLHTPTNLNY